MDADRPAPPPVKTINAALLSVALTYVVFCALFGALAGLENAPVPRAIGSTLTSMGIGLLNGATGFGMAAVARGHGLAFLLVLVVVATVHVKQARDPVLGHQLLTGVIGGGLAALTFQLTFMMIEGVGLPRLAVTLTNVTCGMVSGLAGAWLFNLLAAKPAAAAEAAAPPT